MVSIGPSRRGLNPPFRGNTAIGQPANTIGDWRRLRTGYRPTVASACNSQFDGAPTR